MRWTKTAVDALQRIGKPRRPQSRQQPDNLETPRAGETALLQKSTCQLTIQYQMVSTESAHTIILTPTEQVALLYLGILQTVNEKWENEFEKEQGRHMEGLGEGGNDACYVIIISKTKKSLNTLLLYVCLRPYVLIMLTFCRNKNRNKTKTKQNETKLRNPMNTKIWSEMIP